MQDVKTTAATSGPRSTETRQRIVGAARQLFATVGFERCTVRSVAAEAGIHASLVMRYFGSKEGLFASAMNFDLQLPSLKEVPQANRGTNPGGSPVEEVGWCGCKQ